MTTPETITGLDIKVARIRKGLHQYQLAAALGIPPQRLSTIETGRLPVSQESLNCLLKLIQYWGSERPPKVMATLERGRLALGK